MFFFFFPDSLPERFSGSMVETRHYVHWEWDPVGQNKMRSLLFFFFTARRRFLLLCGCEPVVRHEVFVKW